MRIQRKRLIWLKNDGSRHGFFALRGLFTPVTPVPPLAAVAVTAAALAGRAFLAVLLAFRTGLDIG